MAVYRQRRRSYRWLVAAGALLVALAVAAAIIRARAGGDEGDRLPDAAARMAAQLEVLKLSHYTSDTVVAGRVQQPGEYEAALRDIATVQQEWSTVRHLIDHDTAAAIDVALAELDEGVRQYRPVSEVADQADRLTGELAALRR